MFVSNYAIFSVKFRKVDNEFKNFNQSLVNIWLEAGFVKSNL